jgi:hypothetical protein
MEKAQVNKIRDEKENITMATNEIQKLIQECCVNILKTYFIANYKVMKKLVNFSACRTHQN